MPDALEEMIRYVFFWELINIKSIPKGLFFVLSGLFIFLLTVLLFFNYYFGQEGITVTIGNETNSTISGFKITHLYSAKDVNIPEISPKTKFETVIDPKEEFGENELHLYYFDKNGLKVKETLVGYFEKGYDGWVKVIITEINQDGKMKMDIKSDVRP